MGSQHYGPLQAIIVKILVNFGSNRAKARRKMNGLLYTMYQLRKTQVT